MTGAPQGVMAVEGTGARQRGVLKGALAKADLLSPPPEQRGSPKGGGPWAAGKMLRTRALFSRLLLLQ